MKLRDKIILEFIKRFGNPDEQEVDLCNHYFVGEIYDFFSLRMGEYLLKYLELKQAAEKLAEALENECFCHEMTSGRCDPCMNIAEYRKAFPREEQGE